MTSFWLYVEVVALPGFTLQHSSWGGCLISSDDDPSINSLIDAHTVSMMLRDLAQGGPLDMFNYGFGSHWTIESIEPT